MAGFERLLHSSLTYALFTSNAQADGRLDGHWPPELMTDYPGHDSHAYGRIVHYDSPAFLPLDQSPAESLRC